MMVKAMVSHDHVYSRDQSDGSMFGDGPDIFFLMPCYRGWWAVYAWLILSQSDPRWMIWVTWISVNDTTAHPRSITAQSYASYH